MILVIDNFDSFTYNLVQYIQMLGFQVKTYRNNKITITQIQKLKPSHIIISPGPGTPKDAGISLQLVKTFTGRIPILGVCLGHQVIIEALGGKIIKAGRIVHGKVEPIIHDGRGLFRSIANPFQATRYHSLAGEGKTIPDCLEITATAAKDQTIMGVRHKKYQVEGVQFHPESIGTDLGMKILSNFFDYNRGELKKMALIKKVSEGKNLTAKEAAAIMDEITSGELAESQLGAFLGAMAVKGVTAEELSSFALVLRQKTGVKTKIKNTLDTCGTGGDGKHTFNISTAIALLCAALGVKVAKHGNRAITSKSGSYDFLTELGVKTDGNLQQNVASIKKDNFAFFFAPLFHSAMKHVAKVRREIKIKTIFNMIGPLANPLSVDHQIIGVFDKALLDLFINTLKKLKLKRALVVHAHDGMDEISICSKTMIRELKTNGKIISYEINPKEFGIKGFSEKDLLGGDAIANVKQFKEIIGSKKLSKKQQAVKAVICLNSGAALYIVGKAKSIKEGFKLAQKQIESGKLAEYIKSIT